MYTPPDFARTGCILILLPRSVPPLKGLEASMARMATALPPLWLSLSAIAPMSVLLPTPGGPVIPMTLALPVRGGQSLDMRSLDCWEREGGSSTSVMALAIFFLSPFLMPSIRSSICRWNTYLDSFFSLASVALCLMCSTMTERGVPGP